MSEHGDVWRSPCGTVELRCGRWQDVLADVESVDAVITDPPYGERTHKGQRHRRSDGAETLATAKIPHGLGYAKWSQRDVGSFVSVWGQRCGWMVALTSHCLLPHWERAHDAAGRYSFAPLACIQWHLNVRLAGDGPANWTCYAHVSRPRTTTRVGSLPGAYAGKPFDAGENTTTTAKRTVPGGKPLWLMRAIVRDYSRPGDLVCDPCAGGATTLLAAAMEGRRAIGAEMDPKTFDLAVKRLSKGWTVDMFSGRESAPAEQMALGGTDE